MNLKELVKKVEGEFRISQVKDLEFSFIKEITEGKFSPLCYFLFLQFLIYVNVEIINFNGIN